MTRDFLETCLYPGRREAGIWTNLPSVIFLLRSSSYGGTAGSPEQGQTPRLTLFAGRFLRRRAVFWMRRRQDQGAGPPPALFFRDLKRQGRGRPCSLGGVT